MSHSSKLVTPKEGSLEPLLCSRLIRSTGDNLGLWQASEMRERKCVCVCVCVGGWSCGVEPLICGTQRSFQVDSVKTELNHGATSWCHRGLLVVGISLYPSSDQKYPEWRVLCVQPRRHTGEKHGGEELGFSLQQEGKSESFHFNQIMEIIRLD